jgi:CheY-like chemotaxis protein/glycine cleavage system H lipoate-binding protein
MDPEINILVIDDEQIVLDSIKKHLGKHDYSIHAVSSAEEALSMIDETDFDIVITDLMMPQVDGLELMQIIKSRSPDMLVILITGYATINTALQATQLGAFDYIAKPFSKAELTGVIQRAVEAIIKSRVGADTIAKSAEQAPDAGKARVHSFRTTGDKSWFVLESSGLVLLGVERSFLLTVGRIQSVFLPSRGDDIRQGSVYLQVFCSDMRTHSVISPFSGTVVEVNENVVNNPAELKPEHHRKAWLIRLKPSRFDQEMQMLESKK